MDIILYYNGDSPHIEWCVKSIRHHSPNSPLHVLGRNLNVDHISDAPYYDLADKFSRIYRKESENSYSLEYNAFARWLVMEEYCRLKGITQFAHFDCDILVFCDLNEEAAKLTGVDFTYPPCSGIIFNLDVIRCMNLALFDYFNGIDNEETRAMKDWKLRAKHLSDMALWDLIVRKFKFKNMVEGQVQFESNLHYPEGYQRDENGYRKLTFEKGVPYVHTESGMPVRLLSVHCWGIYKTRMAELWERSLASA